MTNITTFNFKSATIRVVEIAGEPWFVVGDVCTALGLPPHKTNGGYQNHYRRLDTDQLATASVPTPLGSRNVKVMSESGLYKLIMRSDKPEARAFQLNQLASDESILKLIKNAPRSMRLISESGLRESSSFCSADAFPPRSAISTSPEIHPSQETPHALHAPR